MAQMILSNPETRYILKKRVSTLGTEPSHDILVSCETPGLVLSLIRHEDFFEILPSQKIKLNGQNLTRTACIHSCDRVEWNGGVAVFLDSDQLPKSADPGPGMKSMATLQNLAATLQSSGSLQAGLHQILDALVEQAGAESGYLLSEIGGSSWEMIASRNTDPTRRKDLFSNTILQEALKRSEPIYVENMIGHPWAENASVIEARIFSAACFPLRVGERTFGAVFLTTRSPGKSIRREALSELSLLATQAALMMGLQAELLSTRKENLRLKNLAGQDPSLIGMPEVVRKIGKLASTPLSVLILGETGTGKELIARELHQKSLRSQGPFVAVNCAAIPGTLLESTLFGHERGAFTGAVRSQPGKFAQSDGGTLFLDEIGDLPLELQAKLLRVLQEKKVEPLGAAKPVSVDVRILAATHQDLDTLVRAGKFRQDLYFRLNGATLRVPPLRERKGDIPILARHFLKQSGVPLGFSEQCFEVLETYPWPGNVRELEQVVTRAALLCEGAKIQPEDLEISPVSSLAVGGGSESDLKTLEDAQAQFTREHVQRALGRHQGNRALTASELGISERTLYRILSSGVDSPGRTI